MSVDDLPMVAVVDIDGVVADVRHRLHHVADRPKDWRSFFAAAADDEFAMGPARREVNDGGGFSRRIYRPPPASTGQTHASRMSKPFLAVARSIFNAGSISSTVSWGSRSSPRARTIQSR